MEQNQATMQAGVENTQANSQNPSSQGIDERLLVGGKETPESKNPFEELYATGKFQPGTLENMSTEELTSIAEEFINNRREGPKAQIIIPGTKAFEKAKEQVENNQDINISISSLLDEAEAIINSNISNDTPTNEVTTQEEASKKEDEKQEVVNNNEDNIDWDTIEQEFAKLESKLDESERERANLKTRLELIETEKNSIFEELKQAKETIRNRDLSGEFYVPKDTRMYTIVNALKDFEEVASTNPHSPDSEQKQLKLLRVLADTYHYATGGHSIEPMIQQFLIAVGAKPNGGNIPNYSTQEAPIDRKMQYIQEKLNVAGRANKYT